MRSALVVVGGVGRKDPAQMALAEDDDVIEAFQRRAEYLDALQALVGFNSGDD